MSQRAIAVVSSAHPPLDGRIFWKEARTLAELGYEVTQFGQSAPGAETAHEEAGLRFVELRNTAGRWGRIGRSFGIGRELWRRRDEIDVVHVHDPELLLLLIPLRVVRPHVRFVYDVHEDYPSVLMVRPWLPRRLRPIVSWVVKAVENALGRRSDLVIGATDHLAKKFPIENRRTAVVRNFPFASDYSKLTGPRPRRGSSDLGRPMKCTLVGGLTEIRGVRSVTEAVAMLDPDRFQLELVGRFDSAEFQQEIVSIAPASVRWRGSMPFPDIPSYLASQDVGLACLLRSPNHAAALPTKVFEYYHAGLPVVASDFEEWRGFIDGCGLQVDPADPAAIAQALVWLAEHPIEFDQMRTEARRRSRSEFSWEAEAVILADAYERMLSPM